MSIILNTIAAAVVAASIAGAAHAQDNAASRPVKNVVLVHGAFAAATGSASCRTR